MLDVPHFPIQRFNASTLYPKLHLTLPRSPAIVVPVSANLNLLLLEALLLRSAAVGF